MQLPQATPPAPLSLVSATVPAADARPMPPVDDRVAADLRARVAAPSWTSDVRLCFDLRTWQQRNDLSTSEAASRLAVPHVTGDTFARLREFRKPGGAGHHWPELLGLHTEREVQSRVDAKTAVTAAVAVPTSAASTERPIVAPKVPTMEYDVRTTTRGRPASGAPPVDFAALAKRIDDEKGRQCNRQKPRRTAETARLIVAAAKFYSPAPRRTRTGFAGITRVARELYAATGKEISIAAWDERIRGYAPFFKALLHDGSLAPPAATKPSTAPPPPPSKVTSSIVGRPIVTKTGRLLVTVTATMEVGPDHELWVDALAAVNASA